MKKAPVILGVSKPDQYKIRPLCDFFCFHILFYVKLLIVKEKLTYLKKRAEQFPSLPGVYLMKKGEEKILYVGKAKSLRSRVHSYFNEKSSSIRIEFLIRQLESIDYIVTENEVEAFLLEASLIKTHKPRYNIRLKDDKAYPYIRCSVQEDFPRFYFERRVKDSHSVYFGPYTEGWTVRALLDFLNQNFHLRDCSDSDFKTRKRPCLSWDMGICPAPCVKKITKAEYQKNYKKALSFLKGSSKDLVKKINSQMKSCSKELRFEEAARLRDRLRAIEMIEQSQSVVQRNDKDRDVAVIKADEQGMLVEILHFRKGRLIGNRFHFLKKVVAEEEILLSFLNQYYSENLLPDELLLKMPIKISRLKLLEKVLSSRKGSACRILHVLNKEDDLLIQMAEKNAENHLQNEIDKEQNQQDILIEIKRRLKLSKLPLRIECYDVSHWQGSQSIGSQVVFEKALPSNKEYRLYNLKSVSDGDDYLALQELMTRRLNHKEYEKPNMILIDGGKGQLRAVEKILKDLRWEGIPLVALAKDRVKDQGAYNSKITSSGERFYLPGRKNPVTFPSHSKALRVLLHLRDEAHRFAISAHRKKRDKMFLQGDLDAIKGLGQKSKIALLKKFDTLEDLKKLSEKELARLGFVSKALAKRIKQHFSS